jgi:tetratricopeptide (TPR) repeat protein
MNDNMGRANSARPLRKKFKAKRVPWLARILSMKESVRRDGRSLPMTNRERKVLRPALMRYFKEINMKIRCRRLSFLPFLGALAFFCAVSIAQAGQIRDEAAGVLRKAEDLVRQGQYKQAAVEFERASELAGGPCAECLLGVARAYRGAGQHDSAIKVTRMAISILPSPVEKAQAYNQLGSLLAEKGDLTGAKAAFNKAVELDGSLAGQVPSNLAEALLRRAGAGGDGVVAGGAGAP